MRHFEVIPPVPDGYAWWDVIEPESDVMENFAVATFSIHCPGAEAEALALCARLNGDSEATASVGNARFLKEMKP
jgi:hypothetical protein